MKNFIKLLRSVLLCTLIVVCICGCGKGTAQYISSEEMTSMKEEMKGEGTNQETKQEVLSETQQSESEQENKSEIESDLESSTEEVLLYVYVCGAVHQPGVYTLSEGSRVCDLFEAADGLTEEAAKDYWNQARLLVDGEMIYVPTIEEAEERQLSGWDVSSEGFGESGSAGTNDTSGKINLNTASLEQLMEIPGIGESKARAILDYRETNGGFSSIEEVMNIEGIKEGVFSKMKEYVVVN